MATTKLPFATIDEMVFENRNKDYGAYILRKRHERMLIIAFSSTIAFLLLLVFMPNIIEALKHKKAEEPTTVVKKTYAQLSQPPAMQETPPPPKMELPPPVKTIQFVPPKVMKDELVQKIDTVASQKELSQATVSNVTNNVQVDLSATNDQLSQVTEAPKKQEPFSFVEQMPEFPGGEAVLLKWIQEHAKYPEIAKENDIEGTVYVQFVVTEGGAISDVQVAKSVDKLLDAEAVRVISSMPKWNPGKQNGYAVPVKKVLPVKFVLN